jgi:hypothetical protein
MVDMAAITGLATSIRAAVEITRAMKDIHDANLIQTKTFELTREILAAQSYAMEAVAAQSALLNRVRELEEEKAKLEAWNTEKQRYKLTELGPAKIKANGGTIISESGEGALKFRAPDGTVAEIVGAGRYKRKAEKEAV